MTMYLQVLLTSLMILCVYITLTESLPVSKKVSVYIRYSYPGPEPTCGTTLTQVVDAGPGNQTAALLTTDATTPAPLGPGLKGYVSYIGVENIIFVAVDNKIYLNISFGLHPDDPTDDEFDKFETLVELYLKSISVYPISAMEVCDVMFMVDDTIAPQFSSSFYCMEGYLLISPNDNTCVVSTAAITETTATSATTWVPTPSLSSPISTPTTASLQPTDTTVTVLQTQTANTGTVIGLACVIGVLVCMMVVMGIIMLLSRRRQHEPVTEARIDEHQSVDVCVPEPIQAVSSVDIGVQVSNHPIDSLYITMGPHMSEPSTYEDMSPTRQAGPVRGPTSGTTAIEQTDYENVNDNSYQNVGNI